MTDLSKYKRKDYNLLENKDTKVVTKQKIKREKRYTGKITINLTQEEADLLEKMFQLSGVPKTTIIRQALSKAGLFMNKNI